MKLSELMGTETSAPAPTTKLKLSDLMKPEESPTPPEQPLDLGQEAYIKPAKTFASGFYKAAAQGAERVPKGVGVIASEYAKQTLPPVVYDVGKKIAHMIGVPETTEKISQYLADNWATYGDKLKKEGITKGIVKDIYSGLGSAAWQIPEITAMGGMATHGAITGAADGKAGMIVGGVEGAMMHKIIGGIQSLPDRLKYPIAMATGAVTTPGGAKERIAGGAVFAGLTAGKGPTYEEWRTERDRTKIGSLKEKAANTYRTILQPTAPELRKIEIGKGEDINKYYSIMADEKLVVDQSADRRQIDTTKARDTISEKMTPLNDTMNNMLREATRQRGKTKFFDLETLGDQAKSKLDKMNLSGIELKQAKEDIDTFISAEIEKHKSLMVNAVELNDVKRGMWGMSYNPLDPKSKLSAKAARQVGYVARETIEKAYPEKNIRELNRKIGDLATVQTLLESAHGRRIQGSLMNRRIASLTGAIAGSKIPIVGPLAGAYAGKKFAEHMDDPVRMSEKAGRQQAKARSIEERYPEAKVNSMIRESLLRRVGIRSDFKSVGAGGQDIPSDSIPLGRLPVSKDIPVRTESGERVTINPKPGEEFSVSPIQYPDGRIKYELHDGDTYKVNKNVAQDLIGKYGMKQGSKIEMPKDVEEVGAAGAKDPTAKGGEIKYNKDIYQLNMNNLGKKLPNKFDETAIPSIENATQGVMGDVLKNKIYNYLVYYFNKGKPEGIMDSIFIQSKDGVRKVQYKIDENGVSVNLVNEAGSKLSPKEVAKGGEMDLSNTKIVKDEISGAGFKTTTPLEVYHGSPKMFDEFDTSLAGVNTKARTSQLGTFFTDNKNIANDFSEGSGNIKSANLNIKNPLEIGYRTTDERVRGRDPFAMVHDAIVRFNKKSSWSEVTPEDVIKWKQKLQSQGFDGIIIRNTAMDSGGGSLSKSIKDPYSNFYIAFDKSQILSKLSPKEGGRNLGKAAIITALGSAIAGSASAEGSDDIKNILWAEAANDPAGWEAKLNTYNKARRPGETLEHAMRRVSSAFRTKSKMYRQASSGRYDAYSKKVSDKMDTVLKNFKPDGSWRYVHHENYSLPAYKGKTEREIDAILRKKWGSEVDFNNKVKIGKEYYFSKKK